MKKSDRIRLITMVADQMEGMDWEIVDLTLRTFGFPTTDSWPGGAGKRGYVLEMIQRSEDEAITELYEHLFPQDALSTDHATTTDGPWLTGMFRLFASHLSRDKAFVSQVKDCLRKYAVDTFVAHEDIEPTREWISEIEVALATCNAAAALLTPDFHTSDWTDQEIGYCLQRRILLIPIRMGRDPYGFFARFQGLQGVGKGPEVVAREIFDILVKHDQTASLMSDALVGQFTLSKSYNEAKQNFGLLQYVRTWTPGLLGRVETAVHENSQVRGAFGIPEKVRTLLAKYSVTGDLN
jgi:hypothetical protein